MGDREVPERSGWGTGKPQRGPGLGTMVFPRTLSYCLKFCLGRRLGAVFLVETTFQFVTALCSHTGRQVCDARMMA